MQELERRLARFGIRPGLERVTAICEKLGRPQDRMKVILVTGTNGKGSVTAAIASMLSAAGHRTGSYFSPHLLRYNERIKVDGKEIIDAEYAPYEKKILEMHEQGQEMTVFEAITAIAYSYFADNGCEYAVMEIGMGGSYDATNIALEQAAVITNVELEHTEYLGKTVREIARDKSRIIKNPKAFAVTGCAGEALEEARARANETGAGLFVMGKDFRASLREVSAERTVFDYSGKKTYEKLAVPLAGKHQMANAALAVAVAEGLGLGENAIREGLARASNPGRLQVVGKKPLVVADAAHNPAGMKTLVESLDIYPRRKLVCVFTALKDKDWKSMIAMLAPRCDAMVINQLGEEQTERAESAEVIAAEARRCTEAGVVLDIAASVRAAKRKAGEDGMVLICGSIYMLGKAIRAAESK